MKRLLPILSIFLLWGCESIPNLSTITNGTQTTRTSSKAILQLDTKGHTAKIADVIATQSGDIISASADKTIRVWDSVTGKEKRKLLGQIGAGSGQIYAIALSPNEMFLAVGGFLANKNNRNEASAIRIYHYKTGKLLKVLKSHRNVIHDLAFSPDGNYLISGSGDQTAKIWRVNNFTLLDTLRFHTNSVYAVKIFKSKQRYFALTAGLDHQIVLYDLQKRAIIKRDRKAYKLKDLAISKMHIAVSGESKEIHIYDHRLNPIKTIASETEPATLAYSPNGAFLIAGTSNHPLNVNIYHAKSDYKKINSFTKHTNLTRAVAFLDNTTAISAGGGNSEIYRWDINSANVKTKIEGVGEVVWRVSLRGNSIAWGNTANYKNHQNKGEIQKTFNLNTFSIRDIRNEERASFKSLSAIKGSDSLIHKAGGDYGYNDAILELKRGGKVIAAITRDTSNGLRHNSYGFYQDFIISGSAFGELKIYNLQGKEVANLVGHTGEVWSIAIDGDRLVSGSGDQTIRVWDLSQLKPQMQPQLNIFIAKNNEWVVWTPEGFYNASKGAEQYIGYHINQGANKEAAFLDVSRFKKQFYRPDLIAKAIQGENLRRDVKEIDIDRLLTAGLPPQVEILTASHTINGNSTEVGVKICEKDGGIENLNFYIDNKPIQYLSRSKAFRYQKQTAGNCRVIEQRLAIPSGKHRITFNATNKVGNIISNTPAITITNTKVEERKPNLHLLTLSIQDYKDDSLDLTFPNHDADVLSETLKRIGKSVFGEVINYALKDSQVTQAQINAKIAEIAPNVGVNDVFVLYLSGHGITNKDDGDYYFIPYNAPNGSDVTQTAINQQQFKRLISQIKAVKSVILLDTCQSGTAASEALIDTSVKRFGGNVGTAIIAGATSTQDAIDGYKKHGIFTYTLLDAMTNKKVYSFDDKLSINEIAEYTKFLLPKLAKEKFGHEQKPTIYLNGDTSFPIGSL